MLLNPPATQGETMQLRKRRFPRTLVALGVVLVLVSAACSDDDDDATTTESGDTTETTASRNRATAPGVTEKSIKVGGVAVLSSPSGFTQPGIMVGFKARVDRENKEGGVHGRTIETIGVKDDTLNPAVGPQVARELIQQDNVFLAAPVVSP